MRASTRPLLILPSGEKPRLTLSLWGETDAKRSEGNRLGLSNLIPRGEEPRSLLPWDRRASAIEGIDRLILTSPRGEGHRVSLYSLGGRTRAPGGIARLLPNILPGEKEPRLTFLSWRDDGKAGWAILGLHPNFSKVKRRPVSLSLLVETDAKASDAIDSASS